MQTLYQQIQALHTDRFALDNLSLLEFTRFRHTLLTAFEMIDDHQTWHLIGTQGCHLCDDAQAMLSLALPQHAERPRLIMLDLIDSNTQLIDMLGTMIPLLLTPTRLFCYPFGIMDVLGHGIQKYPN